MSSTRIQESLNRHTWWHTSVISSYIYESCDPSLHGIAHCVVAEASVNVDKAKDVGTDILKSKVVKDVHDYIIVFQNIGHRSSLKINGDCQGWPTTLILESWERCCLETYATKYHIQWTSKGVQQSWTHSER